MHARSEKERKKLIKKNGDTKLESQFRYTDANSAKKLEQLYHVAIALFPGPAQLAQLQYGFLYCIWSEKLGLYLHGTGCNLRMDIRI